MDYDNIVVECNTDLDTLKHNIHVNSKLTIEWIKTLEPHEDHAVIVGSGPSVADCIESIRYRKSVGQKIFALNGAAKFLTENDIEVDYTVMVDAREENRTFLGYSNHYLLSAQCAPICFADVKDNVTLWQPYIPDLEGQEPEVDFEFAMIGGGTTVGLSSLCLIYTMGYRYMHLYGYDSSHRNNNGHAFRQDLNKNDSCCYITFDGIRYKSSIAMAAQAEQFPILANDLIDRGCVITVDGDGLLPAIVRRQEEIKEPEYFADEKSKYEEMWKHREYRHVSPGELSAKLFADVVKPIKGYRVVDYGCGTGRGSKAIRQFTECEVIQVDFAENCRDEDCKDFIFIVTDLTKKIPVLSDYGYCTDVMEHVKPEDVDVVIKNIMDSCGKCFFQISTVEDHCGKLIGHPLHLTVQPHSWWREKFLSLGYAIRWEMEDDIAALFFISDHSEKETT